MRIASPGMRTSGCSKYTDAAQCSFETGRILCKEICDPWNFGIELTRPARHMMPWFTLQTLGMDRIEQMISRGFHLARLAGTDLRRLPGWEVIAGTMTMVTFRFSPSGEDASALDWINTLISKKLEAANIALFLTRLGCVLSIHRHRMMR